MKRCARAFSSRGRWRADCYRVTFAHGSCGQIRLPLPENQALTRKKKKAPELGAFAFSLMVESARSIPLRGVASWHSLPQIQNNGPVFFQVTVSGVRKMQNRAEIRATG